MFGHFVEEAKREILAMHKVDFYHTQQKKNKKTFEPFCEKTNNLGSNQFRHKPGCTITEERSLKFLI